MCEMCEATVAYYGEPIPGWHLGRATKDGDILKNGEWSLTTQNNPSFWWSETPVPENPDQNVFDETFWKAFDKFEEELNQQYGFTEVYDLIVACNKVGYARENDGRFEPWLFNYLGMWLQTHPEPTPE